MRLWVMSDLHIDVCAFEPAEPRPQHDVVVIAGDISERLRDKVLPWIERVIGSCAPVIYVPGNHDFYRRNISFEIAKAKAVMPDGVHLLADGESLVIEGVRFIGATLWTDYDIYGSRLESIEAAMSSMQDHKKIRHSETYSKMRTKEAAMLHARHLRAITEKLDVPFDGPTVVISHHAPAPESLQHRRPTEPLDGSYGSDLTALIKRSKPALWVHGHVHVSRDYRIGHTRIVANPRGYVTTTKMHRKEMVDIENPSFDPELVISV